MNDKTQLQRLAQPFPSSLIQSKPGKFSADYITHSVITERLLQVVGPFDMIVADKEYDGGKLCGVLLKCRFVIDGREVWITEAGDVEHYERNSNGSNLKLAISDAIKRCAMRVGVGLQLWSGEEKYALHKRLERDQSAGESSPPAATGGSPTPHPGPPPVPDTPTPPATGGGVPDEEPPGPVERVAALRALASSAAQDPGVYADEKFARLKQIRDSLDPDTYFLEWQEWRKAEGLETKEQVLRRIDDALWKANELLQRQLAELGEEPFESPSAGEGEPAARAGSSQGDQPEEGSGGGSALAQDHPIGGDRGPIDGDAPAGDVPVGESSGATAVRVKLAAAGDDVERLKALCKSLQLGLPPGRPYAPKLRERIEKKIREMERG